ncbi:hypothetical protein [Kitasatospora purpeofusca]|uniref:hypothetical protein n=1 Tax=Kitasatospora purpeofusca TaxID=67352 RepID=UPI003677A093
MEIVEPDHEGDGLMPTLVRVNGTDVGTLAKAPKVQAGGDDELATVTLVLIPREVVIKGEPKGAQPQQRRQPFGFKAPKA